MSETPSPWPVAIVTGMLGSGKTTVIRRILRHAGMADTLVLVNEFGEVGLDHALFEAVTDNVVLLPNGCLCCTIRSDVVQTLREIRRGWLTGALPDFGRILIETTGLAEPLPLITSIVSHPMLADSFALQTLSTVVDGQYGLHQLAERPTCRNQIGAADHLIVSKGDLADPRAHAELTRSLQAFNRLATLRSAEAVDPEWLYGRDAARVPGSLLYCEEASDHLADVRTLVLAPVGRLSWTSFKTWLGRVIDASGARLLRLKGRLSFDDLPSSVIVQAVHQTFYPLAEAPGDPSGQGEDFLVFIFDGPAPAEIGHATEDCRFETRPPV